MKTKKSIKITVFYDLDTMVKTMKVDSPNLEIEELVFILESCKIHCMTKNRMEANQKLIEQSAKPEILDRPKD